MSLTVGSIKILDSFNYLPMPLAALPRTFGLDESKGFFPHLFNKTENFGYKGKIPDEKYFGIDQMIKSTYEEFKVWYNEQKNQVIILNIFKNLNML